jgi:hypothetical protein
MDAMEFIPLKIGEDDIDAMEFIPLKIGEDDIDAMEFIPLKQEKVIYLHLLVIARLKVVLSLLTLLALMAQATQYSQALNLHTHHTPVYLHITFYSAGLSPLLYPKATPLSRKVPVT